jgi:DNA-binding NtrC family response regulator
MKQSGTLTQPVSLPEGQEEAFFSIEIASGYILECNEAATRLLGATEAELKGELWTRGITCADASCSVLEHAVAAGTHVFLPPIILSRADATEIAVGGIVMPATLEPRKTTGLFLWRLLDEERLNLSGLVGASDTLAVLGVDQLRYGSEWHAADTARLMSAMRNSLLEIVRTADTVGLPAGAAVIVKLGDVDIEGARDICRALLSHLHAVHTLPGTATADVRICVGLACKIPGKSALSTLIAANNALTQAQSSAANEPIRAAEEDDHALIAGRVINDAGVFSEHSVELFAATSGDAVLQKAAGPASSAPPVAPIESNIEGYVVDNMEGAVDQAIFLAQLDIPVAIIGPAGTGKMYVARVIHEEAGGAGDMLVPIDCREFRGRNAANARIARELAKGEGKTLVFKSPHLIHAEAQLKLARQISSRTLADVSPAQYLPKVKLIALFPDTLEHLVRKGELTEPLASVFGGYPITVPPIKDRKQAVLRWAHKILGQEGAARDRNLKGFTPDAERAMLLYDWPGNISEMRRCIFDALEKTNKDWLTPVDLGLFKGINPDGAPYLPESKAFLAAVVEDDTKEDTYVPSTAESLDVALGEAVHNVLTLKLIKPLGAWLEDEMVLASLDRYRNDLPRVAQFLHTKPRNISRWLSKIHAREAERSNSSLWQKPRRLLWEWVRESLQPDESPLLLLEEKLMIHLNEQAGALSSAKRAQIMGVSTPTYLKRKREIEEG